MTDRDFRPHEGRDDCPFIMCCGVDPCAMGKAPVYVNKHPLDDHRTDKHKVTEALKESTSQFNKADGGKSNPLLIEVDLARALAVVNRVLDYGAEKYERAGWKKVEPERYDAAARRHRRDRDMGQTFDDESGLIHLAHEACNLLFQIEMHIERNPGVDYLKYKTPPRTHRGE